MDWAKTHQHNNEIMCSFDVCSQFTNVPLSETIEICLTKLYSLPDPSALRRHVLKDLLEFATKKSHFIFDGVYYDQIDGVALGSPLGPILANIFMCSFRVKDYENIIQYTFSSYIDCSTMFTALALIKNVPLL